jgi:hypothetical protein
VAALRLEVKGVHSVLNQLVSTLVKGAVSGTGQRPMPQSFTADYPNPLGTNGKQDESEDKYSDVLTLLDKVNCPYCFLSFLPEV